MTDGVLAPGKKIPLEGWLVLLFLALAIGMAGIRFLPKTEGLLIDEKTAAVEQTLSAMAALDQAAIHQGLADGTEDVTGHAGLIGIEISPLTTTLGSLPIKELSLNPNFAAVIIDLLIEAGVESGDAAAVHFSGSFPAINLAVWAALEHMGVEAVVISSLGASNWGANRPEWTWMHMEKHLYERGWISSRSSGISLGGRDDLGLEMPPALRQYLMTQADEQGFAVLAGSHLEDQVEAKWDIYRVGVLPSVFINVGGNATAYGNGEQAANLNPGVLPQGFSSQWPHQTALMACFDREQIPVIHLLNIRHLAQEYGLSHPAGKQAPVGEGAAFRQSVSLLRGYAACWLLAGMAGLWWIFRKGGLVYDGTAD